MGIVSAHAECSVDSVHESPTPQTGPMLMQISVRLVDKRAVDLKGVFGSSFDAYEYALNRFGRQVSRIEVKKVQPLHDPREERRAANSQHP